MIRYLRELFNAWRFRRRHSVLMRAIREARDRAEQSTRIDALRHVRTVVDLEDPQQRANYETLARLLFLDPEKEQARRRKG